MNRLPTRAILNAAALLALVSGTTPAMSQELIMPVYVTSFESPEYKAGALVGQDGWTVVSAEETKGAAAIEAKTASDGSQAIAISPAKLAGGDAEWTRPLEHAVSPLLPIVDVEWDLSLDAGKTHTGAWQVIVYGEAGRALGSMYIAGDMEDSVWTWTTSGPVDSGAAVKRGEWNHFRIRIDYAAGTLEFSLNGASLGSASPASETDKAGLALGGVLTGIGVRAMVSGDDVAHIDAVSIKPSRAAACIANCDGSVDRPVLNVNDFGCFVNEFSKALTLSPKLQAASYANFDRSRAAPVLNANDFMAFLSAYSAGCP